MLRAFFMRKEKNYFQLSQSFSNIFVLVLKSQEYRFLLLPTKF